MFLLLELKIIFIEIIQRRYRNCIDKEKILSDMQDKNSQLEALANRDSLTGIRNKTAYDSKRRYTEYQFHR